MHPPRSRQRSEGSKNGPWIVRTGQWRLHVQPNGNGAYEAILIAVKLDVYALHRGLKSGSQFLIEPNLAEIRKLYENGSVMNDDVLFFTMVRTV